MQVAQVPVAKIITMAFPVSLVHKIVISTVLVVAVVVR
jgi:hypothetical protein